MNVRSLVPSAVLTAFVSIVLLVPAEGCGAKVAEPESPCSLAGGTCVAGGQSCGRPGPQDCGGDGGFDSPYCCLPPAGACADGGSIPIRAASFDRSCTTAADCVAIIQEGDACGTCSAICGNTYLSAAGYAQYTSAIAGTPAATSKNCGECGAPAPACCRGGVCGIDDGTGCSISP